MKRTMAWLFAASAYITGAMLPLESLWFDPETPVFSDTAVGSDPPLIFARRIKSQVSMEYSVVLRDGITRDVVCEAKGGPFDYLPERSGPLLDKGLSWFAPSDPRCVHLPVGVYYGQVTWTAPYPLRAFLPGPLAIPFGWIIPPKSTTRDIPPFRILG